MELPDLTPWRIDDADALAHRPGLGTNNDVRIIDTPSGSLVWRGYDNLSVGQARTEHRLVAWLASRDLPFQVPSPIRTVDDDTVVVQPDGRPASLHRLIPGRRPADSDRELALTATAFVTLLQALADAPATLAPRMWSKIRLRDIHDALEDPDVLLRRLHGHGADVGWLRDTLDAEDDILSVLATLPQQIVHGDIARSNALTDGERITGLLDFEIAGWDARVTDVGTALLTLGGDPARDDGRSQIHALRHRLTSGLGLDDREAEIMPEVVRLRVAGSVLWRAGRWRAGHSTVDEVLARIRDGAERVRHLGSYAPTVPNHNSA